MRFTEISRNKKEIPEGETIILFDLPGFYTNHFIAIGLSEIIKSIDSENEIYFLATDQTTTIKVDILEQIPFETIVKKVRDYYNDLMINDPIFSKLAELAKVAKEIGKIKSRHLPKNPTIPQIEKFLQDHGEIYKKYIQLFKDTILKIYDEEGNIKPKYSYVDIIVQGLSGDNLSSYYKNKKSYVETLEKILYEGKPVKEVVKTSKKAETILKLNTGSGGFDDVFSKYLQEALNDISKVKESRRIPSNTDLGTQFTKIKQYRISGEREHLTSLEFLLYLIGTNAISFKKYMFGKEYKVYFVLRPNKALKYDPTLKTLYKKIYSLDPVYQVTYEKVDDNTVVHQPITVMHRKMTLDEKMEVLFMKVFVALHYAGVISKNMTKSSGILSINDYSLDVIINAGNMKRVYHFVPAEIENFKEFVKEVLSLKNDYQFFTKYFFNDELKGKIIKNSKTTLIEIDKEKYYADLNILESLLKTARNQYLSIYT